MLPKVAPGGNVASGSGVGEAVTIGADDSVKLSGSSVLFSECSVQVNDSCSFVCTLEYLATQPESIIDITRRSNDTTRHLTLFIKSPFPFVNTKNSSMFVSSL
jgi:hypothetical protein